jgi:hypothetical protein
MFFEPVVACRYPMPAARQQRVDALLQRGRILVCDRDPKWSGAVESGQFVAYMLPRSTNVRVCSSTTARRR